MWVCPPFFEGGMCLIYSLDGQLLSRLCLLVLIRASPLIEIISMDGMMRSSTILPISSHQLITVVSLMCTYPLHACVRDNC